MNTIRNVSSRPLRVPLPRGKTLHLGFGQEGKVSDETLDHSPFRALVDDGSIEVVDHAAGGRAGARTGRGGVVETHGHVPGHLGGAARRGQRGA